MRLPTRGGKVVSAISEIRRLVPQPVPKSNELRDEALKLYRTITRTIYRAPPSRVRDETYQHARHEFERNRSVTEPFQIQHCLQVGWNEYKMFGHYFEEQRHFSKPIVKREYPEKRVEMLQSLLKVTPTHKRQRIRGLLAKAEKRVKDKAVVDVMCARAETQWKYGEDLSEQSRGEANKVHESKVVEENKKASWI